METPAQVICHTMLFAHNVTIQNSHGAVEIQVFKEDGSIRIGTNLHDGTGAHYKHFTDFAEFLAFINNFTN